MNSYLSSGEISEYGPNLSSKIPNADYKQTWPKGSKLIHPSGFSIKDSEQIQLKEVSNDSALLRRRKFQKVKSALKYNKAIKENIRSNSKTQAMLNMLVNLSGARNSAKKMKAFLRKKKIYNDISKLSLYHFNIIGDSTWEENDEDKTEKTLENLIFSGRKQRKKGGCLINFFYKAKNLFHARVSPFVEFMSKYFPLFNPDNPLKIIWDFFLLMLTIAEILRLSIEKSFNVNLNLMLIGYVLTLALGFEILVTINTKLYKDGLEIIDRSTILKHSLKKNFFSDVMPCFFLMMINYFNEYKNFEFVNFFLIFRILRSGKSMRRLKELLIRGDSQTTILNILILIFKIFLWGHAIACLWHFTGDTINTNFPEENNWLKIKGIENKDWKIKYLFSIYWSITTMLTVGYGDITPSNSGEMLMNIGAMILGCVMFGYSMNRIGGILKNADKKKRYLNEELDKVTRIMRHKNLPLETLTKVQKYLQFVWKQEIKENPDYEKHIMGKLSSVLRDEVFLNTNVTYLRSIEVFKAFSEGSLVSLARHMEKVRFSPEEHIFKEGDGDDFPLYIILEGSVQLVAEREGSKGRINTILRECKKGEYFGINELFTGEIRQFGAISKEFTTLFKLNRNDFLAALKKQQDEYEKFCQIKDLDLIYGNQTQYRIKCESCGFFDHQTKFCPFFKYQPCKFTILAKRRLQNRKKASRFKRKTRIAKKNALQIKQLLNNSQAEFLEAYEDDEDLKELFDVYSMDDGQRLLNLHPIIKEGIESSKLERLKVQSSYEEKSPKNKRRGSHLSEKYSEFRTNNRNETLLTQPILNPSGIPQNQDFLNEKPITKESHPTHSIPRREDTTSNSSFSPKDKEKIVSNLAFNFSSIMPMNSQEHIVSEIEHVGRVLNRANHNLLAKQHNSKHRDFEIDAQKSFRFYFPKNNVELFINKLNMMKK